MLPPGDVRNCMVALSEDELLLARLFQYRFHHGGLEGHSFGNLFLAALSDITGDFAQAVQMSSQILAARGRIYPATNSNVTLTARMDSGSLVHGETSITASPHRIVELMLSPTGVEPLPATLEAIANADLITLGPGSLYTSLVTNLLVRGIPEALAASKATRVYIANLMTQANESLGLTASQHIEKILDHCGTNGSRIFDYALINTAPSTASAPSALNPSPATSPRKEPSSATTPTASPRPSSPSPSTAPPNPASQSPKSLQSTKNP
jgi:uncharacterized cofD-like protein